MSSSSRSSSSNGIIGGYWPSWEADQNTPPSTIPASYTHVFYAFVNPDPDANFTVKITEDDQKWMPRFTHHLHSKTPHVKAFLAIGGGHTAAGVAMSAMASEKINRGSFIKSAVGVARKYGFDGLDLDWEYPFGEKGMQDLARLFTELRAAVDQEAHKTGNSRLGISAAVYFAPNLGLMSPSRRPYPAAEIAKSVDFLNLMCYDYDGSWNPERTGPLAALDNRASVYHTRYGVGKWIEVGLPREKLVMGLPLYGRTWKLQNPNNNGIGAPAAGPGPHDSPDEEGYMVYRNVVTFNETHRATEVYDQATTSYYSYAGTDWISYDGVRSIEAKVKYAKKEHLGGYFFWAIGQDHRDNRLSTAALNAWRN